MSSQNLKGRKRMIKANDPKKINKFNEQTDYFFPTIHTLSQLLRRSSNREGDQIFSFRDDKN